MLSHSADMMIVLYALVHIGVVLAVMIHILLHKQNPTAAVGWIGICVFMPWIGVILYLLLGINRVKRKARQLLDDGESPDTDPPSSLPWRCEADAEFAPLDHMLANMSGRPLVAASKIEIIHNGDNAYPLMLEAIDRATQSILLCSYIFRNDYLGEEFLTALIQAKNRGVEVRILVDGVGSGYFYCGVKRKLRTAGVKVARFMHSFLPWQMPFVNLRNHRKILVIDGVAGFMGGLNIGAENILAKPVKGFLSVSDTHFYLEGPIIRQLVEVFSTDWVFTTGETLYGPRYFPDPIIEGDKQVPSRIVTSGPDEDVEKIRYTMLQAMTLARKHICFMSPYFIPDPDFITELGLAAARGVRVDVVVPRTSNHRFVDYARDASLQLLIRVGCRIWLGNPPFNHSKLMTVDGRWSFVGSANLDARSLRLNFEVNLELHDDDIADILTSFMMKHASALLTMDEIKTWSLPKRIRNAALRLFGPYL